MLTTDIGYAHTASQRHGQAEFCHEDLQRKLDPFLSVVLASC
jgi:hypothetical protein